MKIQKTTSLDSASIHTSPQQKKFVRLTKKIEQEKEILAQWRQAQKDVQHKASQEILPMYVQLREIIYQQIEVLVLQKEQKMTDIQLKRLDQKIEQLVLQLLNSGHMNSEQIVYLTELLTKLGHSIEVRKSKDWIDLSTHHTQEDEVQPEFDQEMGEEDFFVANIEQFKKMLMQEYGLESDFFDFEADNQDDFMRIFIEKMEKREFEEYASQLDEDERILFEKMYEYDVKQEEKLKQKRMQAKEIATQSMKEIYLKITALIHPDREQDEAKKSEKTVLFQKVNQAHKEKDIFTLLKVQAELGQVEQKIANEQLKAYNVLLEEQLDNITLEIDDVIDSFDWNNFGMFSNRKIKVQDLHKKYQKDWQDVQQKVSKAEKRLEDYRDIKNLKKLMRSAYLWELI